MWALLLPLLQATAAYANPELWPGPGDEFIATCVSPNLDGEIVHWNGHDYKYHCRRVGPWSASDQYYQVFRPSDCAAECNKRDDCTGFLWLYKGSFCNLGIDRHAPITETPSSSEYLYMERLDRTSTLPDHEGTGGGSQQPIIPTPEGNCEQRCQQIVPECQAAETECKENTIQCQSAISSHQEAQKQCNQSTQACDDMRKYCEDGRVDAQRVKELYDQDLAAHKKQITDLQQTLNEMRTKYNKCAQDMANTVAECRICLPFRCSLKPPWAVLLANILTSGPKNDEKSVLEGGRKFKLGCKKCESSPRFFLRSSSLTRLGVTQGSVTLRSMAWHLQPLPTTFRSVWNGAARMMPAISLLMTPFSVFVIRAAQEVSPPLRQTWRNQPGR